jgi:hypothetical protein
LANPNDAQHIPYFKDWGDLVAVIALIQVWIIALWKKYIKKGAIALYEAGSIEVSFSIWGPSIALLGTLRAINKDIFVNDITITITRLKDKAQQFLKWKAFRSHLFSISPRDDIKLEVASSVLIRKDYPHKYHIYFATDAFANEYRPQVRPYTEAWGEFVRARLEAAEIKTGEKVLAAMNNPAIMEKIFADFLKEPLPSRIWQSLNNTFFWHAGSYRIDMNVSCGEPAGKLSRSWEFNIEDTEEKNLRLNIISCMREVINVPHFYNYVYKDYYKPTG